MTVNVVSAYYLNCLLFNVLQKKETVEIQSDISIII
jgi:hypothetical protein